MSASPQLLVVVVEDDALLRFAMVEDLQTEGVHVFDFATAEGAMALLDSSFSEGQRVHALVTDIDLGGPLTGWDIAEAYRAAMPAIRVVYVSGASLEAGRPVLNSTFHSKPWSSDAVIKDCFG